MSVRATRYIAATRSPRYEIAGAPSGARRELVKIDTRARHSSFEEGGGGGEGGSARGRHPGRLRRSLVKGRPIRHFQIDPADKKSTGERGDGEREKERETERRVRKRVAGAGQPRVICHRGYPPVAPRGSPFNFLIIAPGGEDPARESAVRQRARGILVSPPNASRTSGSIYEPAMNYIAGY